MCSRGNKEMALYPRRRDVRMNSCMPHFIGRIFTFIGRRCFFLFFFSYHYLVLGMGGGFIVGIACTGLLVGGMEVASRKEVSVGPVSLSESSSVCRKVRCTYHDLFNSFSQLFSFLRSR